MENIVMWCKTCKQWVDMDKDRFEWTCPRCRTNIPECRCTRCGPEWRTRYTRLPEHCSSCGSVYWNKRRVRPVPNARRSD